MQYILSIKAPPFATAVNPNPSLLMRLMQTNSKRSYSSFILQERRRRGPGKQIVMYKRGFACCKCIIAPICVYCIHVSTTWYRVLLWINEWLSFSPLIGMDLIFSLKYAKIVNRKAICWYTQIGGTIKVI